MVFLAVGSLAPPHADMEAETRAETDIEIVAADELALEIAWDEEEAQSLALHLYYICVARALHFVMPRLATSIRRLRHDQMEQGPTEPHAGRSTFLLSSGGAGGRVLLSGFWYGADSY